MERGPWYYRHVMQYKDKLPWWLVEWVIRRNVLEQHREMAKVAGVCLSHYMDNLVKLEKLKRRGMYREGL